MILLGGLRRLWSQNFYSPVAVWFVCPLWLGCICAARCLINIYERHLLEFWLGFRLVVQNQYSSEQGRVEKGKRGLSKCSLFVVRDNRRAVSRDLAGVLCMYRQRTRCSITPTEAVAATVWTAVELCFQELSHTAIPPVPELNFFASG